MEVVRQDFYLEGWDLICMVDELLGAVLDHPVGNAETAQGIGTEWMVVEYFHA